MMKLLRIVVLAMIWVALWGDVSAANVFFGLIVATVVTFAFPPLDPDNGNGLRPVAAVVFFLKFAVMLWQSTWAVVVEVVRPKLALAEAIVAVPLRTDDPVIVTMVANGITLTPGTLTVDVGPDPAPGEGRILYVHALTLTSTQDVIDGALELEDLAMAAFPPPSRPSPSSPSLTASPSPSSSSPTTSPSPTPTPTPPSSSSDEGEDHR